MKTTSERATQNQAVEKKTVSKASTAVLPMVDLDTVLQFVGRIEADGLQTLTQKEVAKRLQYAAQTSTPFYRRLVAARLFGVLDTTQGGVNLTKLALDYFKPTDEETARLALFTAVRNVIGYQGIIERFSGKRLPPVDILKNSLERDFHLVSEAAKTCAEVFVRSVQSARLVRSDGILSPLPESSQTMAIHQKSVAQPGTFIAASPPATSLGESESHYLTLDAQRGRRVIVQAPPVITALELKRIQTWLAVQLHVVDSAEAAQPKNPSDETNSTVEPPSN